MRFLNIKKAKSDIAQGRLSESMIFKYALMNMLVVSIFSDLPVEREAIDPVEYIFYLYYVGISVIGYWACYLANGGKSGKDFLPNIACLGWVMGCRLILPFIIAFIMLTIYTYTSSGYNPDSEIGALETDIVTSLLLTWYWVSLRFHMAEARKLTDQT